ncbi:MAG: amidase [Pseudomonadales bacterium]|jgi:Asp-tRNA(Asn)/Glu-tRNA(Gln) amidotransferase A subunit family amidase
MLQEYSDYDAVELAAMIADGDVSALEVLEAAISRAEQINPAINAIVTPMFDEARHVAEGNPEGPLAGVPFLIKDLNMVSGTRCSMGSRLWADFVPDHDSEIVRRYRKAGLVLLGKSNTPEVGLAATTESSFLGACKNPWDLKRTSGGSSGGAAAAVASGIVPAAHATDGGGSIRIPASCCGLVGLKPTRARTPMGPDVGEGWGSMASGHVVSRTVRDSALFLDVCHGPAQGDPYHPPVFSGSYFEDHKTETGKLRIAVDLTPNSTGSVHQACLDGVRNTVKMLEGMGHEIEEINWGFDREEFGTASYILVASNVANTIYSRAAVLGISEIGLEHVEQTTLAAARFGRSFTGEDYAKATSVIHKVGRVVASQFEQFDLIISPTLLQPPVELGFMNTCGDDQELYGERINAFWGFTHLYNASGNPSISLPLHWSEDNLPVGIQFTGAFGNELLLLQLANQLEQAQPWIGRKPPLPI